MANFKPGAMLSENFHGGSQYFGSGHPWADVRAFGAKGDNVTDDTLAIQAAIDHVNQKFAGGVVFFPPGVYVVSAPLQLHGAVYLKGSGFNVTIVTAFGDHTILNFNADSSHSKLEDLYIVGRFNNANTANTVVIADNVPVYFSDFRIWGGLHALENRGIDGNFYNGFILGGSANGGCLLSVGANWYDRMKLDTSGLPLAYAYRQLTVPPGATSAENHWVQSDFSGQFTHSIRLEDTAGSGLTAFTNCVISSPTLITGGRHARFTSCEFGAGISSSAPISVVSSYGFGPISVTGVGPKAMSGNINIT